MRASLDTIGELTGKRVNGYDPHFQDEVMNILRSELAVIKEFVRNQTPIVNVAAPEVTVQPPNVTVEAPVVNVPPAPQPPPPPQPATTWVLTVDRNSKGQISGVTATRKE